MVKIIFLLMTVFLFSCSTIKKFEITNKEQLAYTQHGSFWCWAAAAEAINKYYGNNLRQEDIVMDRMGIKYIAEYMYYDPMISISTFELDGMFKRDYFEKYGISIKNIDRDDIKKSLKNGPIISAFYNHVSLIVGYDDEKEIFIMVNTFADIYKAPKFIEVPYSIIFSKDIGENFFYSTSKT